MFTDEKEPVSPVLSETEKQAEVGVEARSVSSSSDIDGRGDEALKLVGRERTQRFSDEYNAKLRRKLVRCFALWDASHD